MSEATTAGDNPLAFLNPVVETAAPAPDAAPTDQQPADEGGQPRGPDGKFIATAPAVDDAPPAPVAEAPVAETPPAAPVVAPEPGHVPLASLLDERDKRQALEKQLAELQAKATPAPKPAALPDPVDDPSKFSATVSDQIEQVRLETRREVSRIMAVQAHGEDTVKAIEAWAAEKCQAGIEGRDAEGFALNQQLLTSPHPYEAARAAFQRSQMLEKLNPETFEKYLAWEAAQAAAPAPAAIPAPALTPAAPPPKPAPTPPPTSIADLPPAGGTEAVSLDPAEPFRAIFHR